MQKKKPAERNLCIYKTPSSTEVPVFELQGTKDDKIAEGWLAAAIKVFHPRDAKTFSQPAASAFARTSACCIIDCQNRVEVGAHATLDGKRLIIIPACKAHNGDGALDKLKGNARLKKNTIYLQLSLPKGKRIKNMAGVYCYNVVDSPDEFLEGANIFDMTDDEEEEEEKFF